MTTTIRAEDLGPRLRARLEAQHALILATVHEQALRGLVRIDQSIAETKPLPVDRGLYRASWSVDFDGFGADIGSDAPYAPVIEYGARPFWAPFDPLFEWAFRKVRPDAANEDERIAMAHELATAVQAAIARRGLEPKKPLARALPAMRADLGRALRGLRKYPDFREGSGR